MHRPVCAYPFLPLLQARLRVTVNDPLGTVKTYQGRKHTPLVSLSHLPPLCLVVWQQQCMSAPNSSLSSGFLFCCSWASLGYFFLCSCNSDLCLEAPWCLECCQWVWGTGRHTICFTKSRTLLTFGYYVSSVSKAEGKDDNAYTVYYWASRLRRPKSMTCGARWRTLSTASHIKNIVWVKFEAYLLAFWMPAAAMSILQCVCRSFPSVLKYGGNFSNSLLCSRNGWNVNK